MADHFELCCGSHNDYTMLTGRLFFFFFGSSKSSKESFSGVTSSIFFSAGTADELGASETAAEIS